jgi:hypothetical protein
MVETSNKADKLKLLVVGSDLKTADEAHKNLADNCCTI